MVPKIAHIVVGLPVEGPFDYAVPDDLAPQIAVGKRVLVPFARSKRTGYVVRLSEHSDIANLKSVSAVLDPFPSLDDGLLQLTAAMARAYGCSWGEAIDTALPASLRTAKPCAVPQTPPARPALDPTEKVLVFDQAKDQCWTLLIEEVKKNYDAGRGALILVPEVSVIERVVTKLKPFIPKEGLVVDHAVTDKEELECWKIVRSGEARVVIGLRSSVFAPVNRLRLIVMIDEEHAYFKEEQSPFYHARELALKRAEIERASIVFVSSTPSAEMWDMARVPPFVVRTCTAERQAALQLVDLTNYYHPKGASLIAAPLRNEIEAALKQGGRVILFINRRGYSTTTRCLFCGHVIKCQRCDSHLGFSTVKKMLSCPHCTFKQPLPEVCPGCGKAYLRSMGAGIEKLAGEASRLFQLARIERFDKDTAVCPERFDILITTQAILKMAGKISVPVIGVVDIDAEFNRMDFRAAHHAYALAVALRQMATRKLILQSRHIDNYCLQALAKNEPALFYDRELALRQELNLPPFKHMTAVILRGPSQKNVSDHAEALYNLMIAGKSSGIDVLPPQPDTVAKLRDQYRVLIMVQSRTVEAMLAFVKQNLRALKKKSGVIVTVNVDP